MCFARLIATHTDSTHHVHQRMFHHLVSIYGESAGSDRDGVVLQTATVNDLRAEYGYIAHADGTYNGNVFVCA
jgi:hypothetical protein